MTSKAAAFLLAALAFNVSTTFAVPLNAASNADIEARSFSEPIEAIVVPTHLSREHHHLAAHRKLRDIVEIILSIKLDLDHHGHHHHHHHDHDNLDGEHEHRHHLHHLLKELEREHRDGEGYRRHHHHHHHEGDSEDSEYEHKRHVPALFTI